MRSYAALVVFGAGIMFLVLYFPWLIIIYGILWLIRHWR